MSRNLVSRLAVAAVAIPIILVIIYTGGWWLWGMLALFVTVGALEFLVAEGYRPTQPAFWMAFLSFLTTYCVMTLVGPEPGDGLSSVLVLLSTFAASLVLITVVMVVSGMLFSIGSRQPSELFAAYTRLVWGIAYVGILYGLVYHLGTFKLRDLTISGGDRLLFLFGLLWVGDTAAMWIGKAIGKHKLAPTVSPNKTVEGFVGGLAGALAVGVLMIFWKFSSIEWYHVLILAVGCSVFGQLGDLVESMWKRSLGIKDSSAIIPGHGGVLDRFDSLLFAAPVMLAYTILLGR